MNQIIILIFSIALSFSVLCQATAKNNEAFYMLDADMKGTTAEKAKFFIHVEKISDSCWQFDTYNISGPVISSEQYKDQKGTVLHGKSVYFNKKGVRDSIGNFYNDLPNGFFYYFNDTGRVLSKRSSGADCRQKPLTV